MNTMNWIFLALAAVAGGVAAMMARKAAAAEADRGVAMERDEQELKA